MVRSAVRAIASRLFRPPLRFLCQGGGEGTNRIKGLVQLAAEELIAEGGALQRQRAQQGQTLHVSFEASMLEIYNEKVTPAVLRRPCPSIFRSPCQF